MTFLGHRTITARRPPAGDYVQGVWEGDDVLTEFTFDGSLQPLTDRDIVHLPEGQRERARWKVYTAADVTLQTVDVVGKKRADRVVVDGEELVVHGHQDHSTSMQPVFGVGPFCTINHNRYMLMVPEVK